MAFLSNGCATFYWEVPTGHEGENTHWDKKVTNSAETVKDPKRPISAEEQCALARDGAYNHRIHDSWIGAISAAAGAVLAGTATAMLTRQDHETAYYESWGALTGLGVIGLATGIYFLTRAGEDRNVYWIANGAVAQAQADRRQAPYAGTDVDIRTTAETARKTAASSARAATRAAAQASDADAIVALFEPKKDTTTDTAGKDKPAPGKVTALPVKVVAAAPNAEANQVKPEPEASASLLSMTAKEAYGPELLKELPSLTTVSSIATAIANSRLIHEYALAKQDQAATDASEATRAVNALAAEQSAWSHCAAALTSIAGPDSQASLAFAAAISAASGGGGSGKGGGSSSGTGTGASSSGGGTSSSNH